MSNTIRKVLPVLVFAAVGMAACDDGGTSGPVVMQGTADVRVVNAVPNVASGGNLLITANDQPVGVPLSPGSSSQQCVSVNAGSGVNLAFGPANPTGTGLATTLAMSTANLSTGGDLTIIAAGTATDPRLFVLNNATVPPTGANAALRFVSAVPGTFDVFLSSNGVTLNTPIASNLTFGQMSNGFISVPAGTGTLVFTQAGTHNIVLRAQALTLTPGEVRTVLLSPDGGMTFVPMLLAGC